MLYYRCKGGTVQWASKKRLSRTLNKIRSEVCESGEKTRRRDTRLYRFLVSEKQSTVNKNQITAQGSRKKKKQISPFVKKKQSKTKWYSRLRKRKECLSDCGKIAEGRQQKERITKDVRY